MSYATPATRSTGNVIGATQWNELVMNDRWANQSNTDGAPFCRTYRSTNQSIANNTFTPVSWSVNHVDNAGIHSTVVNPSRLTAPIDGWYLVEAGLEWAPNAAGIRYISLVPNGVGATEAAQSIGAFGIFGLTHACMAYMHLLAGQYFEVVGYQSSGGALDVVSNQASHASMRWVRTY